MNEALTDTFGRRHSDLRVSLTDRCPLRCVYCMPAEGVTPRPSAELLTAEEIVRIVGVAVAMGVTRVRLTGGEPLLHPDIVGIVAGIAALPDAPELSMTTCGVGLDRLAQPLAEAGLQRINVSLDTVDADTYRKLTRRGDLAQVLRGLESAKAAGLSPIKLNAVLMRGINDSGAAELLDFALAGGYELRFIEQMPLDGGHIWQRTTMVTAGETLAQLEQAHELAALPHDNAPARRWLVDGGPSTVGIIAAVTEPFCAFCERLRLTADGQLRNCLFSQTECDLRTPLRAGAADEVLAGIISACVWAKAAGHGIGGSAFVQPARPMSAIGG